LVANSSLGDALAVMQRQGNAGSFTAADHIAVGKAALTQIPAPWRTDVLVSIDGAGASHDVIDYLTSLNTAPVGLSVPGDRPAQPGHRRPRRGETDLAATRRFFTRALEHGPGPTEVSTDRAPAYPRVLDELLPAARHVREQYANNAIEADHGRLKSRLRPMRGLKRLRSARVISAGHAFVQNLRRGHYDIATHLDPSRQLPAAFAELALAI
jgi:hypothetical protein